MKIEDFTKIKEELEVQKKLNYKQIRVYDERTRMAKVNQFEYKAGITLTFSVIGYFLLFITSAIIIKSLGVTAFTNIFPGFCYPIALLGGSLGIGAIVKTLMTKKFKTKEKLKAFSTAKTQAEKLEEEIQYKIELEKANNRNKVIDQTLAALDYNETILKKMSNKYTIYAKNPTQSEEETKQKIEELSTLVKEKTDDLDLVTTKKVLHDRFWRIRTKGQKIIDIIKASVLGGIIPMFFSVFSIMLIRDAIVFNSLFSSFIATFAPFIVGIIVTSGYMIKRNRDYKKAFDSLNTKLKNNALEEKINDVYKEQQELSVLINNIIRDISVVEIQLKEQQRVLETIKNEKVSRDLEQTIPRELVFRTNETPDITQKSGLTLVRRRTITND